MRVILFSALGVVLAFCGVSGIAGVAAPTHDGSKDAYVLPAISGAAPAVSLEMLEPPGAPVEEARPNPESGIPVNPFPCRPKRKSPVPVRALYLTSWTVGIPSELRHYAKLADETELNAYVVDIKDMDGHVGYVSAIPEVVAIGAYQNRYDPRKVLATFHAHGVRVIGRIACFKDPVASARLPALAIHNKKGGLWRDDKHASWLNPYNRHAWEYLVAIAKEAVRLGFDEIQFDYVRFPSDGKVHEIDYGAETRPKYEAIDGFLAYARKQLPDVIISADVFGVTCVSAGDTEGIGQYLELIAQNVDYLSPMVYPSHYAKGEVIGRRKYPTPDTQPYAVVKGTLMAARERIAAVRTCETARLRPYLQDFTASWLGKGCYLHYGVADVRAEIRAVKDAGYKEWILWNAGNRYTESALKRKRGLLAREATGTQALGLATGQQGEKRQ